MIKLLADTQEAIVDFLRTLELSNTDIIILGVVYGTIFITAGIYCEFSND